MDATNSWAPPTIGDVRLPDRDLGRRLSRQPSVEMRAKMLGLDWTTVRAARSRLLAGAWLISTVAATAAIISDLGQATTRNGGPVLTVVVVAVAVFASMMALRPVSRFTVLIERNDSSTADRYRALAKLSPAHSLLGYRVHWILVRHAITVVASVTIVTLMARGW
ncbi:MAG TPA: hypothetical protein VIJ11_12430 [Galbitalea sp.]